MSPLTAHCGIYVAVNEAGVRRVLRHVTRQRPSLIAYGTAGIVANPSRLCGPLDPAPIVLQRGRPLVTVMDPLPVLGTSAPAYQVDYGVQVSALEVDFAPGQMALPAELGSLGEQQLALHVGLTAGVGCPSDLTSRPGEDPVILPVDHLTCFALDLYAVVGMTFVGAPGPQHLHALLGGLEIVDLGPAGMEELVECYLGLVVRLAVLPRLEAPVIEIVQSVLGATIQLDPTPTGPDVPHNPAVEADQLAVMLEATATTGGGGGGGGGGATADRGDVRPRVRNGAFDLTAAVSERTFRDLFAGIRDGFRLARSDSRDFGTFTLGYDLALHLARGSVDLEADGAVHVRELDVVFDHLGVSLGIDLPSFCVGGFCLIPNPFGGCILRAPRFCLFEDDPDIVIPLDLGGLITSELSAVLALLVRYRVDPTRPAGMNDWDAHDAGLANHWQVLLDPTRVDIDLFDIADTLGDLLERAVDAAVDGMLGGLPGWARDLAKAILGSAIDVLRSVLDVGDDLSEWLADRLGVGLGLFNVITAAVAAHLTSRRPIEFEDPFPVPENPLPPLPFLIPIEYLGVQVQDSEAILTVDIGD